MLFAKQDYAYGPTGPFNFYRLVMPITLNRKKELATELEDVFKKSNSVVFVNFEKLTVQDSNQLRRRLQTENVGYKVSKKTLIKRALTANNIEGDLPDMPGQIAIAFGEDLLSPAREVYGFQKEHKENISIIGGVFEGKFKNKEEMLSIATIPPLQVLRGMFVNLINSPIQRLVVGLDQIRSKKETA